MVFDNVKRSLGKFSPDQKYSKVDDNINRYNYDLFCFSLALSVLYKQVQRKYL